MGIFNSGYDQNSNRKDSAGYSYDRNSGSHLGRMGKQENVAERFLGKLALICFIIYILPSFIGNFTFHHPGIRIVFWIIIFLWIYRKIRRLFKQGGINNE